MKRAFICLLSALMLISFTALPASAQEQKAVSVSIDGLPVAFDVEPVIQDGRTLVPFRAIAEALGVQVDWDNQTRTVSATDGETMVRLQIGNKTAYCNSTPVALDVPPVILDGRTLIPLRFFSEAFDCQVDWDNVSRRASITSPPREMAVIGFYALGDSETSSWANLFGVPYPETAPGHTDITRELALGWYSLDRDGTLLTKSRTGWQRPEGWEDVLKAAGAYGMRAEMVVHVTDADRTITALLGSEATMAAAAANIVQEGAFYQGINLDFEGLGFNETGDELQATRGAFNRFVALLARQAHEAGLKLTLTLHAPNSAYKGYDYKTLSDFADRIIVMAYDYGQKPEPNQLVIQAVEQALEAVPREKLVLGISVPSETPESLQTKVGIAKRYRLEGIALWRLGLVTDAMWDTMNEAVAVRGPMGNQAATPSA